MHALDVYGQAQGRGAAFAAGLLPLVDARGAGDEQVLHNDLAPGKILTGSGNDHTGRAYGAGEGGAGIGTVVWCFRLRRESCDHVRL